MKVLLLCIALLALVAWPPAPAHAAGVYFDDSGPDIILGSDSYEVGFRKTNGSIAYITNKASGGSVTLGSRHECLWGASFPNAAHNFTGGCHFDANGPNRFSYNWSPASATLTLTYTPGSAEDDRVSAQVTVKPSAGAYFDMQLHLTNHRDAAANGVLFPCDTVFAEAKVYQALLPAMPGVMLNYRFFAENRTFETQYPGDPGMFADFAWLATGGGNLAIYSLTGQGSAAPVYPTWLGFVHDEEYVKDSTYYRHTFGAPLPNGASFTTPWVRLRLGASAFDAVNAYRVDNGMDRYPTLAQRLGPRYDQIVASPLYKADTAQIGRKFGDYASLLARVPAPGILHPVAFQPRGHDENYPDFLPPAAAWGTTADMAAMFRQAQARGLLVMPYSNPTWWDDESPTLANLPAPLTVSDVAVLDQAGDPVHEWYGPHYGDVMSPYPAFVKGRLGELVRQMTEDVPGDLLFEDQIGARRWLFDHNASSPSPLAYLDGWLGHTRTYSNTLLMTELGFDRLAETEVGFHGSILLPTVRGEAAGWWGTGSWQPYPFATALARDKTLFYQHDLAPETMTTQKAYLAWNMAMGYQLSYDLVQSEFGGGLNSEWLGIVSAFQKYVLSAYAGQRITGFTSEYPTLTRTDFETCQVRANYDTAFPADTGGHTLPPSGVMVNCGEHDLVAGVFTRYNNAVLSPGEHYLIEMRDARGITVRQPSGPDTDLTIVGLVGRHAHPASSALALDASGAVVATVPVQQVALGAKFHYAAQINGSQIAAYRLSSVPDVYLPLLIR